MEQFPKSIFELLVSKNFRMRTAMYLGEKKISLLRAFTDGCFCALYDNNINCSEKEKFAELHDWVADYFGWRESTAGWKNIIPKCPLAAW